MDGTTFAPLLPEMRTPGDYRRVDNQHYIDLINYMIAMTIKGQETCEFHKIKPLTNVQNMVYGSFITSFRCYSSHIDQSKYTEIQIRRMYDALLSYHTELYRFINGDSPVGSAAPIAYLTQMRLDLKDNHQERLMKWPAIHFSELLIDKYPVIMDSQVFMGIFEKKLIVSMREYDNRKNFSSIKTVAEILNRNLNNQKYLYGLMFRLFHAKCVNEQPNLKGNENGII